MSEATKNALEESLKNLGIEDENPEIIALDTNDTSDENIIKIMESWGQILQMMGREEMTVCFAVSLAALEYGGKDEVLKLNDSIIPVGQNYTRLLEEQSNEQIKEKRENEAKKQ